MEEISEPINNIEVSEEVTSETSEEVTSETSEEVTSESSEEEDSDIDYCETKFE